ncbi:hypothetical protein AMAG_08082 [Allomyces macrogynus ATCC 38327]|uniref:Cytochrome P450 n=1 Tax=Allomyces macrogynus (strain ATCC 38327) TaxID=578462 RepID=A0A0L0SKG1_ALLM3|nr:hypothetical protein AMAG_08082 [Allomyces macrogynus ATCC 38327]|eukprot:KNE62904.1 hypothetical protein AMAG_08082 [Allomyces macrogynus ATCC 38327]
MGGNQLSLILDPVVTTAHALHANAAAALVTYVPQYQHALTKVPKTRGVIAASLAAVTALWIAKQSIQQARTARKLRAQGVPEQIILHPKWWLLGLQRYLIGHLLEPVPDMAGAIRSEQQIPLLHGKNVDGWDRTDQVPLIYMNRLFFGSPSLVVADPKALHAMLSAHSYTFIKPETSIEAIGMVTGNLGMVTINGDVHKRHRRIVNPLFNMKTLMPLLPVMISSLDEFCAFLDTFPHSTSLPFHEMSGQLTLNVIGRTGMNYEFNALALEGTPITRAYNEMQEVIEFTPWFLLCLMYPNTLGRIPTASRRQFWRGHRVMIAAIKDMLTRARAEPNGTSLIHELIRQNEGNALNEYELVCETQTFLGAGHETTSSSLAMAVLLLAQFPDVQDNLAKELAAVDLGDYETLSKLPRLNSVINETMRLFPPGNLTFREAGADITVPTTALGPLALPKGLEIEIPIRAIHMDTSIWGPDAMEWNPQRWDTIDLVQGGNMDLSANRIVNGRRQIGPYDYFPFLVGPRGCIGRQFAVMELRLFIAGLVRRYKLATDLPVGGEDFHVAITMRPTNAWVRVERRAQE